MKKKKNTNWITPVIVIVILLGIALATTSKTKQIDNIQEVVDCLNKADAKLYAHVSCTHCQAQKAEFKEYVAQLNIIECSTNPICQEEGIEAYPTWEINGRRFTGEKSLESLNELCK